MAFTLTVALDPKALAAAQKLSAFQPTLQKHLIPAISASLTTMQEFAIGYCFSNFINPTGALELRFFTQTMPAAAGVTGQLFNDAAHAWRREAGFSGMTDSLGRTFRNDPGIAYMDNTLKANMQVIHDNVLAAAQAAFAELGV